MQYATFHSCSIHAIQYACSIHAIVGGLIEIYEKEWFDFRRLNMILWSHEIKKEKSPDFL